MKRQESSPGVITTVFPISLRNLDGRDRRFLSSIVCLYSPINIHHAGMMYVNRGIQTHYRRQKPSVSSIQISQGNGKDGGNYARTRFLPLHLYGWRVGKNFRSFVGVSRFDALIGQSWLQPLSLG